MDPIKNLIAAADPAHTNRSVPDSEDALRRILSEPAAFTDTIPPNVTSLTDRKQRRARLAGVLALAAAAVTVGMLVATNLGTLTPGAVPANTGSVGSAAATAGPPSAAATSPSVAMTATDAPSLATTATDASSPDASSPEAPSSAASSSAASSSGAANAAPPAPTTAEKWQTYSSADGKVSFDYPAEWTVAAPAGAAGAPNVDVDVSDATGVVVASLHYGPSGGGLGGACQNPVPYVVLDSVELALPHNTSAADTITPRFAFRALQEPGRVTASYGITGSLAGKDGKSCMFYNVVSGPAEAPLYSFADTFQVNTGGSQQIPNHKGAKTFPSLEAAKAYMRTSEYLNAKRMIASLKIQPS